jgi:uncharacterized membrane protein YraQ (UPF0718 family)
VFTDNPFLAATAFLLPRFLQAYVVLMVLAVIAGTLFDLYHKRSAQFFAQQRAQSSAAQRAGSAARSWRASRRERLRTTWRRLASSATRAAGGRTS